MRDYFPRVANFGEPKWVVYGSQISILASKLADSLYAKNG